MSIVDRLKQNGITPRAVAYARYSSDNQRAESIDAQLRAIREYADRQGITLVRSYEDKAISGTSDQRPSFQQMVAAAQAHDFDLVLVHKLDRFARNRYDSIGYRVELRKHGVTVISVLEQLDEDAPESVILESVLEGMNEYYSRNLSREVMKGMRENALKCQHVGGTPPLGFDVDPVTRRYRINADEAAIVRRIFQGVLEGKGYSGVLSDLNANGLKTKRGGAFGKNSLYDILRNEKYRGVYIFNRATGKNPDHKRNNHKCKDPDDIIRIEDGMPRIVSDEDFFRVQTLMDGRKCKSARRQRREVYLLSGKIYCGECGAVYCGNTRTGGRSKTRLITYRCNNRVAKTALVCRNKEINRDAIEAFVLHALGDILFDDRYVPEIIKGYNAYVHDSSMDKREELARIRRELTKTLNKIENLTNVIAETGNVTLITALERSEKERNQWLQREKELLTSMEQLTIPDNVIQAAFNRAKLLFHSGELEETRQLIQLYVDRITVYPDRIDIKLNALGPLSSQVSGQAVPILEQLPEDTYMVRESVARKSLNHHKPQRE